MCMFVIFFLPFFLLLYISFFSSSSWFAFNLYSSESLCHDLGSFLQGWFVFEMFHRVRTFIFLLVTLCISNHHLQCCMCILASLLSCNWWWQKWNRTLIALIVFLMDDGVESLKSTKMRRLSLNFLTNFLLINDYLDFCYIYLFWLEVYGGR